MAAPEFVTLSVEDGVGTIRLDRPKMNAIDEQLHHEVRAAAMEAGERTDVRAVVIYGGERVFAAGAADDVLTAEVLSDTFGVKLALTRTDGRFSARRAA